MEAKFFTDCNVVNRGEAELRRLFKREVWGMGAWLGK
jgi:hypothetical protein